jgi:tryptophan synthase alpha chain
MRAITTLPLAAGFGISTPEQAHSVAQLADGVAVGSAFVRLIEQGGDLESFARSLRNGIDG